MIALAAISLLQASVTAPAAPSAFAVPATDWSCTFEKADGGKFSLSGRIDEIPGQWDPNAARPTRIEGEGFPDLVGPASSTANDSAGDFRNYQIGTSRGDERYFVNLKLRRGGPGVAYITRYVPKTPPEPYSYFAAGLCTSRFDATPRSSDK